MGNVDFAPPKDYKEPERRPAVAPSASFKAKQEEGEEPPPEVKKDALWGGTGQRVDGNELMPWKNRIPKGVKWVNPPYGFGMGHMTGSKVGGSAAPYRGDLFEGGGQHLMW